jgi:hypothetical protein
VHWLEKKMSKMIATIGVVVVASLSSSGCGGGCGARHVESIAVREVDFRSDRYPLPLTDPTRKQLLMYLAVGGDKAGLDDGNPITIVYPDAEQRWGDLLTALQDPSNVDDVDLSNGTFKKWFAEAPLRQIVDATAQRPNLACPPYAVRQDRFVWIFECGAQGKLGKVFVQLHVAKREGK